MGSYRLSSNIDSLTGLHVNSNQFLVSFSFCAIFWFQNQNHEIVTAIAITA